MSERLRCFVIMPYSKESDLVYRGAIVPALMSLPQHEVLALRADTMGIQELTLRTHVEGAVRSADFCIADVRGGNPNVMYELGFAKALGKPVLLISDEESLSAVPSDVRASVIIGYRTEELGRFRAQLSAACEHLVASLTPARPTLPGSESQSGLSSALLTNTQFLDSFVGSVQRTFSALVGSAAMLARQFLPRVRVMASRGVVVRAVCANPEGEYARVRSIDSGRHVAEYRSELWQALEEVRRQFTRMEGWHAELRITESVIGSSIVLLDDVALILPYFTAGRSRESVVIAVKRESESGVFSLFEQEFARAWSTATPSASIMSRFGKTRISGEE